MREFGVFVEHFLGGFLAIFIFASLFYFAISKVLRFEQRKLKELIRDAIKIGLAALATIAIFSTIIGIATFVINGFWQMGLVFLVAIGGLDIIVIGALIVGCFLSYGILPVREEY